MRAMNFRTLPRLRIARLLTNDDGNAEYLEEKPSSRKRSNNEPVRLFESVEITDCYLVDLKKNIYGKPMEKLPKFGHILLLCVYR